MSRTRFASAKRDACERLDRADVLEHAAAYLQWRCRVPRTRVVFDAADARRRIAAAGFLSVAEARARNIWGMTDGDGIWVTRGLTYEATVETLMHEALHDSLFVWRPTRGGERKGLSADLEHEIMVACFDV